MSEQTEVFLQTAERMVKQLADEMKRKIDWSDRYSYGLWLAQEHYHARHATRITSLAATRIPYHEDVFHLEFLKHGLEEHSHDLWALEDLTQLGLDIHSVPELPQISAIYQSLFYLVDRVDPAALGGYALLVEGLSAYAAGDFFHLVEKNFGANCGTLLRAHSHVDQKHILENINYARTRGPEQLDLIRKTFFRFHHYYMDMVDTIHNRHAFMAANPHLGSLAYERSSTEAGSSILI